MNLGRLHVLVFREADTGLWVAICLEYDFATQAESLDDLPENVCAAYAARVRFAQARGERPFDRARRAPDTYWRRFESAAPWRELELAPETVAAARTAVA